MAPIAKQGDREDRLQATLTFAKCLSDSLARGSNDLPSPSELQKAIDKLASLSKLSTNDARLNLDKLGTSIWNLGSKRTNVAKEDAEHTCLVRLFGCLLVEGAQKAALGATSNDIRVLKCTLKASKYCLEHRQLNLAEIAIEKAAIYEDKLRRAHKGDDAIEAGLSCQYHFCRIAVAWRQGRLDLAKLMLARNSSLVDRLNGASAEELADILFEIGKDQLKLGNHSEAIYWLERAYDLLVGHGMESMSSDAAELKLTTMHNMVRALMHMEGDANRNRAWNIVHELCLDHGERLAVTLLKLDLYAADPNPAPQAYSDVLESIIGTVHLTEKNLMTILHHVHRLRAWKPSLAHTVLSSLVFRRLLGLDESVWLEKTLITLVWNCTTTTDIADPISALESLFHEIHVNAVRALSRSAIHAAQMLFWKCIESSYQQQQYDKAEDWCRLALLEIFKDSGASNVGKLQRKRMLCALHRSDSVAAYEIHSQMSATSRNEPATHYLLYKIALRSQDLQAASEYLDWICKASTKDATVLYACVLEAQKTGDQTLSITALQKVLQKYNYGAPEGIHLPALLRCTARLLLKQVEKESSPTSKLLDDVCKLFEGAAKQAKLSRRDLKTSLFVLAELDWFSRNSYNLALQNCTSWDHEYTLRIIDSAVNFINLYPKDLDVNIVDDLSLRKLFCHFLAASLMTVMARKDNVLKTQMQLYLRVREAVDAFRSSAPSEMDKLGEGAREDLQKKYTSLLAYDFEAAARLKAWDSFPAIIKECQTQHNPSTFAILANITMASEAPTNVIITTLQQIINVTWAQEGSNIAKLSRWMRCLFTLALTNSSEMAEQLLEQAISIIENAQKNDNDTYPSEELEWLATTAFNHAIDFYCSNQDAECRRWAEQALRLSYLGNDGGSLHALLQGKYQNLAWEER